MTTLNQFFPAAGGGGSGAPSDRLIPAEIVVVGGGTVGYTGSSCGCRCPIAPVPCGPTYNCSYSVAGNGGATIHAQNYLLKPGQVCPVQVGSASTIVTTCAFSVGVTPGFYGSCTRITGSTAPRGPSYFGGVDGLCADGACTEAIATPSPYQPNSGTICASRGSANVSDVNSYDTFIVVNSVITRNILGPQMCVFGRGGSGGTSNTPAGACGGICVFGSEQICLLYGAQNSGKGSSTGSNLPPAHPGFPDANYVTCGANQDGTVIVKYPTDFPAAPSFPGACDCSPQTPGFYTYRFVSPGSITLP